MNKFDNTTSVLSISSKNMDCSKVIEMLKYNAIISSVVENNSVQCAGKECNKVCWLEKGCRITTSLKSKFIKTELWKPLKKEFDLDCAHLWVHGKYRGCVTNFKQECSN